MKGIDRVSRINWTNSDATAETIDIESLNAIPLIVQLRGQVDVLAQQVNELHAHYDERTLEGGLFQSRRNLSRAGVDVQPFDIFGTVDTLVGAARLYVAELHADLDARERTLEAVAQSPANGRTTPRSWSWRNIRRLFRSGNTSPANRGISGAVVLTSSSSVGNLLDDVDSRELVPSILTTYRREFVRRMSTDASTALAVVQPSQTLRPAHYYSDVSRYNVHQVLRPPLGPLGWSGTQPSDESSLDFAPRHGTEEARQRSQTVSQF